MKKISYLLSVLLCVSFGAKGQYYETGQDPASLKWRQINTENFQLIYPADFETEAQRLAYVFEQVYAYASLNLQQSPKKISVVLHTQTVKSNALVAWAPKRVEFFTTPHQQIYAQDWLEQLAVHEFTHVMQMDQVQQSLPFLLKALLGEQAAAIVVGAYLPFWLLEGEAVANETAFTETGRGRLPSFLMETKALVLEKDICSLSKSYLGSYANYVPNHYHLGYWLTAKAREKYGSSLWIKGFDRAARRPWSVSPLNATLKKETGLNQTNLYKQLFSTLKNDWINEIAEANVQTYEMVSPLSADFVSYRYAKECEDGVIALRESMEDISRIVNIDTKGQEQVVCIPGQLFEESLSAEGNLLIWSERRTDLRWAHADRSVICIFNRDTRQKQTIHTENKIFAPRISPDLNSFAAVEVDSKNQCYLSVFSLQSGERLQQFHIAENDYIFTPCWNDAGDKIFFVALDRSGKYLAEWKVGETALRRLLPSSFYDTKNPEFRDGLLYFASSFSGIDNIYALNPETGEKYRITSVPFGAVLPSVSADGKTLLFSNYSSDGFRIEKANISNRDDLKIDRFPEAKFELADNLSAQLQGKLTLHKPDSVSYESRRYGKLAHALNLHSWAPLYVDADEQDTRPGVSFFSQNKLGTTVVHAGYDYETSEKTGRFVAGVRYSGWYPVIELNGYTGKRASEYYQITQTLNANHQVIKQDTLVKRYTWNEKNIDLNIKLPLNLSSGRFSRLLRPEIQYELTQLDHDTSTPDAFFRGNYQKLGLRLYFHNLQQSAQRDLQSRWGQAFMLNYNLSPAGDIEFGHILAAQSYWYFPGLLKNHGLRLYQGWQQKELSGRNGFSDLVRIPRGYYKLQNTEMFSFVSDYSFPIAYPDWNLGKLLYLKRLRASLFYDYAQLTVPLFSSEGNITQSQNRTMQSLGVELQSDIHVLRLYAPLEVGVRSIYRPDMQDFQFEFLFSVNLSAL